MSGFELWKYKVGQLPHRVIAYEHADRKLTVYLKWRVNGEWVRKSLGYGLRNAKGKVDRDREKAAIADAGAQYDKNIRGEAPAAAPATPPAPKPVTIAQGWKRATDPSTGRWPVDTMHRREMARAIDRAKSVWGASTPWNDIDKGQVRALWRAEMKRVRALGFDGARAAQVVVTRVMALADWLREEGLMAGTSYNEQGLPFVPCSRWKTMKDEMHADLLEGGREITVARPRYTLEEFRALLSAAWDVEERFGFILAIGAEYRLGQVVRVHRRHLDLHAGELTIPGAGKKGGAVVRLTPGQLADTVWVLTHGYLAGLEEAREAGEITDYPLFPEHLRPVQAGEHAGQLITGARHASRPPMEASSLREWLNETERRARVDGKPIPHVDGRGWYGLRRAAVDAAKAGGISREGLQAHGGWSDTQMPDAIYADQKMDYARGEASRVRARLRGETGNAAQTDTGRTQPPEMQNGAEAPSAPSHSNNSNDNDLQR